MKLLHHFYSTIGVRPSLALKHGGVILNGLTRLSPAAENVFIDHGVDVWRCESFFWFIKKTVK